MSPAARKLAALTAKTAPTPTCATSTPATAGPTERAMFWLRPESAAAERSWVRGTSCGTIACHAGRLSADADPSTKVMDSRSAGVMSPAAVSPAIAAAVATIAACAPMR